MRACMLLPNMSLDCCTHILMPSRTTLESAWHSVVLMCIYAVRDTLAEANGSIRVIARVRPLCQVDLRPGTKTQLALEWLFQYLAEHPRVASSRTMQLALPQMLGWQGSLSELMTQMPPSKATSSRLAAPTYRSEVQQREAMLSMELGPVCLPARGLPDGSKQSIIIPGILDFGALVRACHHDAEYNADAATSSSLFPALETSTSVGCQGWFDKVFWPEASELDIFEGMVRPLSLSASVPPSSGYQVAWVYAHFPHCVELGGVSFRALM